MWDIAGKGAVAVAVPVLGTEGGGWMLRCVHRLRAGSQVQVSSRFRCVEVWIVSLRCSAYVFRRRANGGLTLPPFREVRSMDSRSKSEGALQKVDMRWLRVLLTQGRSMSKGLHFSFEWRRRWWMWMRGWWERKREMSWVEVRPPPMIRMLIGLEGCVVVSFWWMCGGRLVPFGANTWVMLPVCWTGSRSWWKLGIDGGDEVPLATTTIRLYRVASVDVDRVNKPCSIPSPSGSYEMSVILAC